MSHEDGAEYTVHGVRHVLYEAKVQLVSASEGAVLLPSIGSVVTSGTMSCVTGVP